ncbi:hypothetical protein C8R43DRAFT_955692 [Mycena crocata]|nr:hypothetical protein C8R43DRAFT_955692 [Mycena crocata]
MTSSSQFTNSLTVPQTSARQNSSLEHTPLGILSSTKKTRQTARMTTGGRPPRRPIIREDDTTSASLPQCVHIVYLLRFADDFRRVPMAPSRSRQTATLVASDSPPPPQPDTDRVHSKRSPLGSDVAKTVGRRQTARMSTGCRPPRREPAIQNSVRPLSDSDRHSESSSGLKIVLTLAHHWVLPGPNFRRLKPVKWTNHAQTRLLRRSFRRAQSENSDSAGDEQTQPVPGYLSLSGRGRIFKLVKRYCQPVDYLGPHVHNLLAEQPPQMKRIPPLWVVKIPVAWHGELQNLRLHLLTSEEVVEPGPVAAHLVAGDESDGGDSMGSFIVADDLDSDDSQEVAVTYRKGDISATAQVHVTPQSRTGSVAHNQVFFDDEAEESDEGSGGSDDSAYTSTLAEFVWVGSDSQMGPRLLPATMVNPLVVRYLTHPELHLAGNVYGEDFAAIRESSAGDSTSVFVFKEYGSVLVPTESAKGYLRNFSTWVFGEVIDFQSTEDGKGLLIQLACPTEVSCRVQKYFHAQLKVLRDIVSSDLKDLVRKDYPVPYSRLLNVHVGCRLELKVDFRRVDVDVSEPHEVERVYTMSSWRYERLEDVDIPRPGPTYECDLKPSLGDERRARVISRRLEQVNELGYPCWWIKDSIPDLNSEATVFGYVIGEYVGIYSRFWEIGRPRFNTRSPYATAVDKAYAEQCANISEAKKANDMVDMCAADTDRRHGTTFKIPVPEDFMSPSPLGHNSIINCRLTEHRFTHNPCSLSLYPLRMGATLQCLGEFVREALYEVDFAATSKWQAITHSAKSETSSAHLPYDFWRKEAGRPSVTQIILSLPPNANETGLDLHARQSRFLQEIREIDEAQCHQQCKSLWGIGSEAHESPTVAVNFFLPRDFRSPIGGRAKFSIDFKLMQFKQSYDRLSWQFFEQISHCHSYVYINMVSSLLQRASADPKSFLCNAIYHEDYTPTRDRTCARGDSFTFKHLTGPEMAPTVRRRGLLRPYEVTIFGQVDMVYDLLERRGLLLRLICPDEVSCAVKEMYFGQLDKLTEIINIDTLSMGGSVETSWFNTLYNGRPLFPEKDCFYVAILVDSHHNLAHLRLCAMISSNIQIRTGMKRVDAIHTVSGDLQRTYTLKARQYESLDDDDIPAPEGNKCRPQELSPLPNIIMSRFKDVPEKWYPATVPVPFDNSVDDVPPSVLSSVERLAVVSYGLQWESVFHSLDILTLFKLSVRSTELLKVVLAYVNSQPEEMTRGLRIDDSTPANAVGGDTAAVRGDCDVTSGPVFPAEIFLVVMEQLKVPELVQLAQVSQFFRAVYPRRVQQLVDAVLLDFGLEPAEIRFMQAATLAIIAGPAMSGLLSGVEPVSGLESMEFMCTHNALPWVTRFFHLATPFRFRGHYTTGFRRTGTVASFLFKHVSNQRTIQLYSTANPSALHGLPSTCFTHQFGAITYAGLLHIYPVSTFAGISLPNRPMVSLSNHHETQYVAGQVADLHRRGYTLSADLPGLHTCGSKHGCPSTPRTTMDRGCFVVAFSGPLAVAAVADVYPVDSATAWNLGGCLCDTGRQMLSEGLHISRRNEPIVSWKWSFNRIVELDLKSRDLMKRHRRR